MYVLRVLLNSLSHDPGTNGYAFYIYIFIYLAAPGLSSIQDLLVMARRIQFPVQGLNPGPLHWECRVLAPGLPQKSCLYFLNACSKWFVNA